MNETNEESKEESTEDVEEQEEKKGVLSINLKDTKIELEKRKGFFNRLFKGKTYEVEQEVVTQVQYLEKIYEVFKEMGYENVLELELNGESVYGDEENKDNDFQEALSAALDKEPKKDFSVQISLDTTGDQESNIEVNMNGQHEPGDLPLVVEAYYSNKTSTEIKELLESVKTKINEKFGIESGEIELDKDEEETETEEDNKESTEEKEE